MKKLSLILTLSFIANGVFANNVENPKIAIVKQYYMGLLTNDEFIQKYGDTTLRQSWAKQDTYLTWVSTYDNEAITECGETNLNLEDNIDVVKPTYRYQLLDKNTVKVTVFSQVNPIPKPVNSANFRFNRIGSQYKISDIAFANGRSFNQNVKKYCHR